MANLIYTQGLADLVNGTIDYLTATIKVLLLSTAVSFTEDQDITVADAGGANDIVDAELNVTGYTRGWGGSGRKTLASKTISVNNGSNRVEFDAADVTWTALATGQTISDAVVVKEGGANDTTTRPIAHLDVTDTPTNGSDVTLQFNSAGIVNLNT